jgi:hypothetical protein
VGCRARLAALWRRAPALRQARSRLQVGRLPGGHGGYLRAREDLGLCRRRSPASSTSA